MDVTVAVLTFHRNAELAGLLPQLVGEIGAAQKGGGPLSARVVVVDNDPDRGAAALVHEIGADAPVRYVSEPVPGIPAARNRALDEAQPDGILVFIDDDERPTAGWLLRMLEAHGRFGSAAVSGPVESVFDGPLDPWIANGGFFQRAHRRGLVTGTAVAAAATNNLLLDMAVVNRHGLRFDTTLGMAGGEDTLFTRRLVAAGESIIWCAEAVVLDHVSATRMTRAFVLRHVFAQSHASIVAVLRLAPGRWDQVAVRLRHGLIGLLRVLVGGVQALVGTVLRRDPWQASGLRVAARGLGATAAVAGVRFEEYRR
ncbi:glycosyl transferase family 2 [mine drainage metagenome]|uniref:Glycosyl transferase family 2 n=1 Tax=mine drainage metagenome TaxID=410659 RepID=A0A1J5RUE1_9ZZZZ